MLRKSFRRRSSAGGDLVRARLGSIEQSSEQTTVFKAKYFGSATVDSGDVNKLLEASKDIKKSQQSVKIFVIIGDAEVKFMDRGNAEVLQNHPVPSINEITVNPGDKKQIMVMTKSKAGLFYCHVLSVKEKAAELVSLMQEKVSARTAPSLTTTPDERRKNMPKMNPKATAMALASIRSRPIAEVNEPEPNNTNVTRQASRPVSRPASRASSSSSLNVSQRSSPGTSPATSPYNGRGSMSASAQRPVQRSSMSRGSMSSGGGLNGAMRGSVKPGLDHAKKSFKQAQLANLRKSTKKSPTTSFQATFLGTQPLDENIIGQRAVDEALAAQRAAEKTNEDEEPVMLAVSFRGIQCRSSLSGELIHIHFIKHICFTCCEEIPMGNIFAYITTDERLGRVACHLFETSPGVGDKINNAVKDAFKEADKLEKLAANPFAVTDPKRERVEGLLFQKQIHRADLTPIKQLGAGQYGDVFLAKQKLRPSGKSLFRAVKILKSGANPSDKEEFKREAETMFRLQHKSLVAIVGVALQQRPWLVVLEYLKYGDLQAVLSGCREKRIALAASEQVSWALQLAEGLAFMASQRIVHMDIAARNCLLGERNVVKVADFGLARPYDEDENFYYMRERMLLPLKWVAVDAINSKKFSEQSDVWAYGVLLWEIITYGSTPYKGVPVARIQEEVQKGLRLPKPRSCPEKFFDIISGCWNDPDHRPTFTQLCYQLKIFLESCPTRRQRDLGNTVFNEHSRSTLSLRGDQKGAKFEAPKMVASNQQLRVGSIKRQNPLFAEEEEIYKPTKQTCPHCQMVFVDMDISDIRIHVAACQTAETDDTRTSCPVCHSSLKAMSDGDASIHVKFCESRGMKKKMPDATTTQTNTDSDDLILLKAALLEGDLLSDDEDEQADAPVPTEIKNVLETLGLSQYIALFANTSGKLSDYSDSDLERLGVIKRLHRMRIIEAAESSKGTGKKPLALPTDDVLYTNAPDGPPRLPQKTAQSSNKEEDVLYVNQAPDCAAPQLPPKETTAQREERLKRLEVLRRQKQLAEERKKRAAQLESSSKTATLLKVKKKSVLPFVEETSRHSKIYMALNPQPLAFQTTQDKVEQEDETIRIGHIGVGNRQGYASGLTGRVLGGANMKGMEEIMDEVLDENEEITYAEMQHIKANMTEDEEEEEDDDDSDFDESEISMEISPALLELRKKRALEEQQHREELKQRYLEQKRKEEEDMQRTLDEIAAVKAKEHARLEQEKEQAVKEARERLENGMDFGGFSWG